MLPCSLLLKLETKAKNFGKFLMHMYVTACTEYGVRVVLSPVCDVVDYGRARSGTLQRLRFKLSNDWVGFDLELGRT